MVETVALTLLSGFGLLFVLFLVEQYRLKHHPPKR